MTAFEAKNQGTSLRWSVRSIAWIIMVLFLLCGLGECLNIHWSDLELPQLVMREERAAVSDSISGSQGFSILVLAARRTGHERVAAIVNGFLLFSCLSAANTALYVASRVLYGLCRTADPHSSRMRRSTRWLAKLDAHTDVPFWAVLVSASVWIWVLVLHAVDNSFSIQKVSCHPYLCFRAALVLTWNRSFRLCLPSVVVEVS